MACQRCKSDRILSANAKCSDCFDAEYRDNSYQGYVPHFEFLGGGDYLEIKVCLECGQVQGTFPVSEELVREALLLEDDVEEVPEHDE